MLFPNHLHSLCKSPRRKWWSYHWTLNGSKLASNGHWSSGHVNSPTTLALWPWLHWGVEIASTLTHKHISTPVLGRNKLTFLFCPSLDDFRALNMKNRVYLTPMARSTPPNNPVNTLGWVTKTSSRAPIRFHDWVVLWARVVFLPPPSLTPDPPPCLSMLSRILLLFMSECFINIYGIWPMEI